MRNTFNDLEPTSAKKEEHFINLVYDSAILECKVLDLPKVESFPATSEDEWENHRFYGLRSADAYLMVYDVTKPSSFHFLQHIRDQIAISRGLCEVPIVVAGNKTDLVNEEFAQENERETSKMRQDISTKVKKAWKLNHIGCSAKFNYDISAVFKELTVEILSVKNRKNGVQGKLEKRKCCLVCI